MSITNKPLIIALGYKRRRGKNTIALYMKEIFEAKYGITNVKLTAFAEPIKNHILTGIFGLSPQDIEEYKTKPVPGIGLTSRQLLQTIGTDYFRAKFGNDIWLKVFEREYVTAQKYDVVLASDLRFSEEMDLVKKHGGFSIKVNRWVEWAPEDDHFSENAMNNYFNWDYTIENNGAYCDLVRKIQLITESIMNKCK